MSFEYIENRIIIGLVLSDTYISQVHSFLQFDYFASTEARIIAGWCFAFYEEHKGAPKDHIHDIYQSKLRQGELDETALDWFDIIFETLAEEIERTQGEMNMSYLVTETEAYCKERALRLLAERVLDEVDNGESAEAEGMLARFVLPEKLQAGGVFPIDAGVEHVRSVFEDQSEPIVQFPGVLNQFFGNAFARDSFVAFMGPEKSGKSFWLMETAFRAIRSGCRVAFFQAGDMSEKQMELRIYSYLMKQPRRPLPGPVLYPVLDCIHHQNGTCTKAAREPSSVGDFNSYFAEESSTPYGVLPSVDPVELFDFLKTADHTPCTACLKEGNRRAFRGAVWYKELPKDTPVFDWKGVYKKLKKYQKRYKNHIYLESHSNDSLSVQAIENSLDIQEKTFGFIPDVIIVDYADLLVPNKAFKDERGSQNHIWKQLRALSEKRKSCVVTATQADAASYDSALLHRKNFSEDKRKYAHVTAMYGINQMEKERGYGLSRLNTLVLRDGYFSENAVVKILGCLSIGRPLLSSFF